MGRIFFAAIALLTMTLWVVSASAQQLSLGQISSYLNDMRAAQAKFVQANPDKTLAQGVLYIQKPGKIRYEYTTPADSIVISDGKVLGVLDKKSNRGRAQRYDLRKTPLDILLQDRVDLQASGVVQNVTSDGVKTEVIAVDPKNARNGTLTMVFTANPTELRQWIVTDRSGKKTTVILNDMRLRGGVGENLFDISAAEEAVRNR